MADKSFDKPVPAAAEPGNQVHATSSYSGPSNQLAQRRAVKTALDRQKVMVGVRRFGGGEMTARVLVDGEYYDVDAFRLAQLQSGLTPADLMLDPVPEESE